MRDNTSNYVTCIFDPNHSVQKHKLMNHYFKRHHDKLIKDTFVCKYKNEHIIMLIRDKEEHLKQCKYCNKDLEESTCDYFDDTSSNIDSSKISASNSTLNFISEKASFKEKIKIDFPPLPEINDENEYKYPDCEEEAKFLY